MATRFDLREQRDALADALERYVVLEEQAAPCSSSPLREAARAALHKAGRQP